MRPSLAGPTHRRVARPLRALVVASFTALALSACGGAPVATVPVPAGAPAGATASAPARPPRRSPVFFHVVGTMHATQVRNALRTGPMSEPREVALQGVDVVLQPRAGGVGIAGRLTQSPLGAKDLGNMEAGLLFGSPGFSLEAAYATRNGYSVESGMAHDSVHVYVRGGLRMRAILGNSGFAVGFRAGYFLPPEQKPLDGENLEGWEGETYLTWVAPRFPISALVGYRIERFAVAGHEQESSALVVGGGFTLGGRR